MDYQFTAKMQAALLHYANDPGRNKRAAYEHGYNCENMQPQTIAVKSTELFKHPLMAQAVSQMKATAAAKVTIDAAWVLERLALLANFNINRFLKRVNGKMYYDFEKATDDDWYCISEITMEDSDITVISPDGELELVPVSRIKLKAESKKAALKMVGQHAGVQAFQENVNLTGAIAHVHMDVEEFKQARRTMLIEDDC